MKVGFGDPEPYVDISERVHVARAGACERVFYLGELISPDARSESGQTARGDRYGIVVQALCLTALCLDARNTISIDLGEH